MSIITSRKRRIYDDLLWQV